MTKINELNKDIDKLQTYIKGFKEYHEHYNNEIKEENEKLKNYMKSNKYDNYTIGKYTNINNLLDLTFEQVEIKDISILKHIIKVLKIKESRCNNMELITSYNEQLNRKQDQLNELKKYGRIFTA